MKLHIHNTFSKQLPADKIHDNYRRQVLDACFSYVTPKQPSNPQRIHIANDLANKLGFSENDMLSEDFLNIFSGKTTYPNTHPYAMCYGGHQFGQWAGQLGDGRAINLFETNHNNQQWVFQLKGAGETPYSRSADGLAVLRSSVREHLCSEAMHYLGVPTTRSLSLCLNGDEVLRDIMYNGNAAHEKGAIVCRVAPSFIRFGNFEILAARENHKTLEQLANYTISNFYPEISSKGPQKYLDFLSKVKEKTIDMIVHWQRVGFVHGVMNTDNMSILGLTIDYGPYGWLEGFDYNWTPNTTDAQNKRYRFGNQPYIGLWNLYKLANALYPLVNKADSLQEILDSYELEYLHKYESMMHRKLGLQTTNKAFIADTEKILQLTETDYTIFFRNLANIEENDTPKSAFNKITDAFYHLKNDEIIKKWIQWFEKYLLLLKHNSFSDIERKEQMNTINPKYVLRNYMAQLAIDKANNKDFSLINDFYELLKKPYDEQPNYNKWFVKRPEWARNKIGCSMLSCSS
ncbi:protein adenylyltransferase SelO [Tenacibaculum geojense]|uniref:Protein nucleotidyltransferase YdiU n=1 Tax=Tenacibaculum geojense TaxID=915352 RepID=A0ABW3JQF8_9FLAO